MKILQDPSKFSFGATSSTVTSLGLIFGLLGASDPKASIIESLLVIAVADNISDSLGIHIYRESESLKAENTKIYTLSNFITRLGITVLFILLFAFLPLQLATSSCIILGLAVLTSLSYLISLQHKTNPLREIFLHVGISIPVIIVSHFIGQLIFSFFL